jgi:hypothetical protein
MHLQAVRTYSEIYGFGRAIKSLEPLKRGQDEVFLIARPKVRFLL